MLYRPEKTWRKLCLISNAFARRLATLGSMQDYDAVYVFREAALMGPPFIERWICRSGVPMIFDFDDAIFLSYKSPSNGYLSLLKFPAKTRTICRLASHVMAGNPYLADYASQQNDRVTIVPTTIDTEKYRVEPAKPSSDPPVIG